MILDAAAVLAALLEPDLDSSRRVVLDVPPIKWEEDVLYVYPLRVAETAFETGPSRRQDFDLNAVYIAPSSDEAHSERDPQLAVLLDGKRGAYMSVVRLNEHGPTWEYLSGAVADSADPKGLDKRSAAVRVSGWRFVE